MNKETIETIFRGILHGTAVGDSLGLPAEGLSRNTIRRRWKNNWSQGFYLGKGMVSDDTEHTVLVARALMKNPDNAELFQKDLAAKLRWSLLGLPISIGKATLIASFKLWLGIKPGKNGIYSAGNGPAMKCAIIGAFFAEDETSLRQYVKASTLLTHTDPRAETASLAIAMTAAALTKSIAKGESCPDLLEEWKKLAPEDEEWQRILSISSEFRAEQKSAEEFALALNLRKGVTGYAYHTVPVVLYVWSQYRGDYKTGLETLLNLGGDTDTTGAIFGALAGIDSSIPDDWLSNIKDYPYSPTFLSRQAALQSDAFLSKKKTLPDRFPWYVIPFRNFFFFLLVVIHCFRRIIPC